MGLAVRGSAQEPAARDPCPAPSRAVRSAPAQDPTNPVQPRQARPMPKRRAPGGGSRRRSGASAGGLEHSSAPGRAPVHTGMAFVLVQHLDARHERSWRSFWRGGAGCRSPRSRKTRRSSRPRVRHSGGKHDVAIRAGYLKLVPRTTTRACTCQSTPSCARWEAQGSKAIGVILSGTASDGTLGVKAIKGGRRDRLRPGAVLGRVRRHAASAIASGCVDFILPPKRIAQDSLAEPPPYVGAALRDERADEEPPSGPKGRMAWGRSERASTEDQGRFLRIQAGDTSTADQQAHGPVTSTLSRTMRATRGRRGRGAGAL